MPTLPPSGRVSVKNTQGMTIVETIVSIFVGLVLIVALTQSFVILLRLNDAQKIVSRLTLHADRGIARVAKASQESKQVLASAVISGTTYTTSSTELVLQVPSINASGQIINGSFDTVVYRRNPSSTDQLLEITDGLAGSIRTDGTRIVSQFVTNLIFRYNNSSPASATIVTVFIKTATTVHGTLKETASQTTVKLRNL